MMNKCLPMITILMMLFLVACGPPQQQANEAGEPATDAEQTQPEDTPTKIVLATPTPQPAPSTPTPKPPTDTPMPLESAVDSETETPAEETTAEETTETTTEEPQSEPESAGPAITDDMVLIPAGSVTLGQDSGKPKNGPAYTTDLLAYEIDRFEVTNDDYKVFVEASGYATYAEEQGGRNWQDAATDKGGHPAVYITWNDATAFCEWAGKRLPTEAEWEKAARGEDGRIYPWGNEFSADQGNFKERGIRGTTAVGSFPGGASPYGVEDMAGNVREWVNAFLLPYEGQASDADPYFGEEFRIHRGGGWFDDEGSEVLTTYNRNAGPPDISANDDLGFRCARDVK